MHFNFEQDIVLENELVLLKPLTLDDAGHLLPVALSDELLLQFSPKQVHSPALLQEYVETALLLRHERLRYSFSIYHKQAGCYAGSTAFLNISNPDDRLEIGATWIHPRFQGTDLNRQCKQLLLTHAFDTLLAHRVEFRTDERNGRSRRAIEKIGGKFEGILREHTVMSDGYRRNTVCYSILKTAWHGNS